MRSLSYGRMSLSVVDRILSTGLPVILWPCRIISLCFRRTYTLPSYANTANMAMMHVASSRRGRQKKSAAHWTFIPPVDRDRSRKCQESTNNTSMLQQRDTTGCVGIWVFDVTESCVFTLCNYYQGGDLKVGVTNRSSLLSPTV